MDIQRLETLIEGQAESERKWMDELADGHREVKRTLYGNGDVGLTERVRTLERVAASISGWGKWLKTGVAGVILKALWDLTQTQTG